MADYPKPRLDYINMETARSCLHRSKTSIADTLELLAGGAKNLQTLYSSFVMDYRAIGLYRYALGYPLSDVKQAFSDAAKAYLKVFDLRGTEPPFPAYSVTYDPRYPPADPRSLVEFTKLYDENAKDFSVTSSRRSWLAVCVALVAGEDAVADQLAAMIWDPPDAPYVAWGALTTPNHQRLAYALRQLFLGDTAGVASELKGLRPRKTQPDIGYQAIMVRALAINERPVFMEGLWPLLAWHEKQARLSENRELPEFYVCISGLALCNLAVRRQLCTFEDLPRDNVFLPVNLIAPLMSH